LALGLLRGEAGDALELPALLVQGGIEPGLCGDHGLFPVGQGAVAPLQLLLPAVELVEPAGAPRLLLEGAGRSTPCISFWRARVSCSSSLRILSAISLASSSALRMRASPSRSLVSASERACSTLRRPSSRMLLARVSASPSVRAMASL